MKGSSSIKKGKSSPAKAYRAPEKTSYGSSGRVRESTAMSFAKPRKRRSKQAYYDKYA